MANKVGYRKRYPIFIAVFVDRCLFGDEPMTRDMLRWLYTAMTRATERLYFVNFDERFFEG